MKVTIIVDGILRTYQGSYEELHTRDWNEKMQGHLDDAQSYNEDHKLKDL